MKPDTLKVVLSVDARELHAQMPRMASALQEAIRHARGQTEPQLPVVPALLAAGAAAVATTKRVSRRALIMPWRTR